MASSIRPNKARGNLIKVWLDGTGFLWLTTVTNANEGFYNGAAWMPDGQSLLAAGTNNGTNGVYVIAADGSGGIRSRLNTPVGDPLDWVGRIVALTPRLWCCIS
ncbi:MAG: hypothetical protein M5U12_24610 [Verrucomicrobia bacterium]|nr:hypothetical protein [Verrucomicrobiota bacterium]